MFAVKPITLEATNALLLEIYKFLGEEFYERVYNGRSDPKILEKINKPSLFKEISPLKYNYILRYASETLENIIDSREKITKSLDKYIQEVFHFCMEILSSDIKEEKSLNPVSEELMLKAHDSLFQFDTIKFITLMELFKLEHRISEELKEKSVAAGILLQLRLSDFYRSDEKIDIRLQKAGGVVHTSEGEASALHMAWALLADEKICYKQFGDKIDSLVENIYYIAKFYQELIKNVDKIYEIVERSDLYTLHGKLSKLFDKAGVPSSLKGAWVDYFLNLIFGVKKALSIVQVELERDIFEKYVNACIQNHGFFEYEVYSLLINEDFPAIPKICIDVKKDHNSGSYREIDILTMTPDNKLVAVEVSSSTNVKSVKEKIDKILTQHLPYIKLTYLLVPRNVHRHFISQGPIGDIELLPLEEPEQLVKRLKES